MANQTDFIVSIFQFWNLTLRDLKFPLLNYPAKTVKFYFSTLKKYQIRNIKKEIVFSCLRNNRIKMLTKYKPQP